MTASFDATAEAVALIRYAMDTDDASAQLVIARAREVDAIDDLIKALAITSVSAFRIGFRGLAKPLLDAALTAATKKEH